MNTEPLYSGVLPKYNITDKLSSSPWLQDSERESVSPLWSQTARSRLQGSLLTQGQISEMKILIVASTSHYNYLENVSTLNCHR